MTSIIDEWVDLVWIADFRQGASFDRVLLSKDKETRLLFIFILGYHGLISVVQQYYNISI